MMKYILDDSALSYMLESFPRKAVPNLFKSFCDSCDNGDIVCEKETRKVLDNVLEEEPSYEWLKQHSKLFRPITQKESKILGELVDKGRFDFVSKSKLFIRNIPVAIPFIFAIAISEKRVIVIDKKSANYDAVCKLCKEIEIEYEDIDDFLSEISA